jgi:hypothetical protein
MADIITIQYGSYIHAHSSTNYTLSRSTVFNSRRTPVAEMIQISLMGRLKGINSLDCDAKLTDLVNAYSVRGVDFHINIGAVRSVINLRNSDTIGGIRVTKMPSLPDNKGAAHVGYINYTIELEAQIPFANTFNAMLSFEETLSFRGGGPRFAMIETLFGLPVKQQVRQATIYYATQSGSASGLYRRPRPPAPIFPFALNETNPDFQLKSSKVPSFTTPQDFGISWKYEFQSDSPLIAYPNEWNESFF